MRWYDHDNALRHTLDGLRLLDSHSRHQAVAIALDAVEAVAPGFIDDHVDTFDLPIDGGRRWYDDDGAETWLLFHGLELAGAHIRQAVVRSLEYCSALPAA